MDRRMYVKDGSSISEFPVSMQKSGKGPRGIIIILILVFIGVLGFMGYRYLGGSSSQTAMHKPVVSPTIAATTPAVSPTASISATPTATPSATTDKTTGLDRSKLTVTVQNGSGVAGVAGKMSALLTKLGYTVSGSGNADVFTYTNVTIKVKAAEAAYIPLLKKDLSDVYTVDTTTKDLPATSATDAVIIVGK